MITPYWKVAIGTTLCWIFTGYVLGLSLWWCVPFDQTNWFAIIAAFIGLSLIPFPRANAFILKFVCPYIWAFFIFNALYLFVSVVRNP